jgi:hypothetical protein
MAVATGGSGDARWRERDREREMAARSRRLCRWGRAVVAVVASDGGMAVVDSPLDARDWAVEVE